MLLIRNIDSENTHRLGKCRKCAVAVVYKFSRIDISAVIILLKKIVIHFKNIILTSI